jgi:DNA repair protein RadC
LSNNRFEDEKIKLTPKTGFNLVGIDYFEDTGNQLYIIEHFDMYQDALNAKKDRKNQEEYFVLYMDQNNECVSR